MLLCAIAGVDPASGTSIGRTSLAGFAVEWWLVGATTFLTRRRRRQGIRAAAAAADVSVATMSRAECGQALAVNSFLRIAKFVGLPPTAFLRFTGNPDCNTLIGTTNPEATVRAQVTATEAQ